MESKWGQLKQDLTGFLAILMDTADPAATRREIENADSPHMELIDFDRFAAVLQETIAALEMACGMEREKEIVRKWFIDRIVSLDRGRQAILRIPRTDDRAVSLDDMPLPGLVRRFEEESARLRSTAAPFNQEKYSGVHRAAEIFKPFKS